MSDKISTSQMKTEITKLIDEFNHKIDSYLEAIKISSSEEVINGSVEHAQELLDLHQEIEGKKEKVFTCLNDFVEVFDPSKG